MLTTKSAEFRTAGLVKHALAAVFLLAGWFFLKNWYLDLYPLYYFLFLLCAIAGFAAGAGSYLRSSYSSISKRRLVLPLTLLFLCLPWGEWLDLGTIFTREEWSKQLFIQAIFLYALIFIWEASASFKKTSENRIAAILEWLSNSQFILWAPPALFFILTSCIAIFIFKQTPIVPDSAAHLFQAQIFQHFRLFAPAPPVPDVFNGPLDLLILKDGKWFGIYFPGYAALLSQAMHLKAEWLVSPLLGSLTIALWIAYAIRWHGRPTALLVGYLCLLSPFMVVMSSTIMVFAPELFFASAVIFFCRLLLEKSKLVYSLLLSLSLFCGILVRSFSIFPFLAPALIYSAWVSFKNKQYSIVLSAFFGIAAGTGLLLLYQAATTGSPLVSGYNIEFPDLGWGFGSHFIGEHTPLKSLNNISNNVLGLNHWLTASLTGSLLFVFLFFVAGKFETWDRLMLTGCALVVLFYFFFFFQDLFFGPRYYYIFAPFLLLIAARSAVDPAARILHPFTALLLISSLLISIPFTLPKYIYRYKPDETQAGKLNKEIKKAGDRRLLVILDKNVNQNFVNWNDPFLKRNIIFVRNLPQHVDRAVEKFPGYEPVYFRMNASFEKGNLNSGFGFYPEPERHPPGYLSLFEVATAIQAAKYYPDRDFFDICYVDLFNSREPAEQLQYLYKLEQKAVNLSGYRKEFHMALIHSAKMMLLPILAFKTNGLQWQTAFSPEEFRADLKAASGHFQKSREVGVEINKELKKVEVRIDSNHDQNLSDEEVYKFLDQKIKLLIGGGSL